MFASTARRMAAALGLAAALLAVFAVPAFATPSIEIKAPSEITENGATLHSVVSTDGLESFAAFEYTLDKAKEGTYTKFQTIPAGAKSPVEVSEPITGLQPNTTYYVRAGAIVNGKEVVTNYIEFKTAKSLGFYHTVDLFHAIEYPAQIATVEEVTPVSFGFVSNVGTETVSCKAADFETELPEASKTISLDASISGCSSGTWAAIAVKMNSCHFDVTLTEAFPLTKVGIGCDTAGDGIELTMFGCKVKFPAQSPIGGYNASNSGEGQPGSTVVIGIGGSPTYTTSGGFCGASGTGSIGGRTRLGAVG